MLHWIKKYMLNVSLKMKLIIAYTILVTGIILVIGVATYDIARYNLENREKALLYQNLKKTGSILDFNLEMYLRKCEMIFSNTSIQKALGKDYSSSDVSEIYDTYQNTFYGTITPIMQELVYPDLTLHSSTRGIGTDMVETSIYTMNPLLPPDGLIIKDFEPIKDEAWVKEMLRNPTKPYWRGLFSALNGQATTEYDYISINRIMRSFESMKELGVLLIKIPIIRLNYLLSQGFDNEDMSLYLMDEKGSNIISIAGKNMSLKSEDITGLTKLPFNDKQTAHLKTINDRKYLVSSVQSDITGWNLIEVYKYSTVSNRLDSIKLVIILVFIAGFVVFLIFTVFISHLITRRIDKIMRKMDLVKADRHTKLYEMGGNDEIGQLDRNFNDMVRRINELAESESKHTMQKAGLQLELLQSQINPHMLYNTLSTIQWRTKKAGIEDVNTVIDRLIRFFKYYLNNGIIVSSIGNEIDIIRQYQDIIRFTYQMDFETKIEIDERILSYYSLNLLLQPIVENALIHGIRPSGRPGLLVISGEIQNEILIFTIRDNGIGVDPDKLERMRSLEPDPRKGGYGLANVVKRIRLYLGEMYGVTIESVPGEGTKVELRVPALTLEQMEAKVKPVI
ncbi:sensor histidine kinase [Paenibacillus glycanilyticus]|uniref:histidine kinase n=1 Tax=Paenibacillus glycanilyticus TaxID=126569 RepID=A0ABQ6GCZ6_9BACL|nr:sensor histidine kinase [Paenibacillus glycanilyticus]GLX67502.1 hypothetical protein MU1_18470 [Paenibacillus glycanilyticus]